MKTCPKCKGLLEDDGSCSCGYTTQQKRDTKQQPRRCAYNDHGQTCGRPGYLSLSTNGEGAFYCRSHYARLMGWPALEASVIEKPLSIAVEEITRELKEPYRQRALEHQAAAAGLDKEPVAEEEPMSAVDERVNHLVPRLSGESEHDWSMRCRDWTLARLSEARIDTQAAREPGED